jgi:hypothetical protein
MTIKAKWPIEVNGISQPAGTPISLSDEEEEVLVTSGYAEYTDEEEYEGEYIEAPYTESEFAELGAEVQRKCLEDLGIDPGSNEKLRITQYAEWLGSEE